MSVMARAGRLWWAILWCVVMCAAGLTAGRLYRTEALRAIIARECWQSGQWLYPVLYGEPFLTKPPGHYLAIAVCSWAWGEVTEGTARLPSVLAALSAVAAMAVVVRREWGREAAGLFVVLAPVSFLWLDKVPSAEIDMTLVGGVTLALLAGYQGVVADRWRVVWSAASLLALLTATLTKWTAPAFYVLTMVPWLLGTGRWRQVLCWQWFVATILIAVLGGAWLLAVGRAVGWATVWETLAAEAAYRLTPHPAAKGVSLSERLLFPLKVVAGLLPASALALYATYAIVRPGVRDRFAGDRHTEAFPAVASGRPEWTLFLCCWVWINLAFWALVPNSNVRYVLPIAPAVTALGVAGWLRLRNWCDERFRRGAVPTLLAAWLVVKCVHVAYVMPQRSVHRDPLPAARALQTLVPDGVILYIDLLKDEGVMFYYGRPVRRCRPLAALPPGSWAAATRTEWEQLRTDAAWQLLAELRDQQGDPLLLLRRAGE